MGPLLSFAVFSRTPLMHIQPKITVPIGRLSLQKNGKNFPKFLILNCALSTIEGTMLTDKDNRLCLLINYCVQYDTLNALPENMFIPN